MLLGRPIEGAQATSLTQSLWLSSFCSEAHCPSSDSFQILTRLSQPQKLLSLDDDDDGQNKRETEKNSSLQNLYEYDKSDTEKESHKTNLENPFIDFEDDETKNIEDLTSQELDKINAQKLEKSGKKDPLTDNLDDNEADKDDISLLNEILNAPSTEEDEFSREWQAVFGPNSLSSTLSFTPVESDQPNSVAGFMPSSLLDRSSDIDKLTLTEADSKITQELSRLNSEEINSSLLSTNQAPSSTPSSSVLQQAQSNSQPKQNKTKTKMDKKPDMSAWFSLFADLDPLANPDAIGKKGDELADAWICSKLQYLNKISSFDSLQSFLLIRRKPTPLFEEIPFSNVSNAISVDVAFICQDVWLNVCATVIIIIINLFTTNSPQNYTNVGAWIMYKT